MVRSFLLFMIPPPFSSLRGGGLLFGLENNRVSKFEELCACTWSFRIRACSSSVAMKNYVQVEVIEREITERGTFIINQTPKIISPISSPASAPLSFTVRARFGAVQEP